MGDGIFLLLLLSAPRDQLTRTWVTLISQLRLTHNTTLEVHVATGIFFFAVPFMHFQKAHTVGPDWVNLITTHLTGQ